MRRMTQVTKAYLEAGNNRTFISTSGKGVKVLDELRAAKQEITPGVVRGEGRSYDDLEARTIIS